MKSIPALLSALVCLLLPCASLRTHGAETPPIIPLPTTETAFIGRFAQGPIDQPVRISSVVHLEAVFGSEAAVPWPAEIQARQFFANGGGAIHVVRIQPAAPLNSALVGDAPSFSGLHALTTLGDLRLLIVPELAELEAEEFRQVFSEFRSFLEPRRIFLILDPPASADSVDEVVSWTETFVPKDAAFCAAYHPRLRVQLGGEWQTVGASGSAAAVYHRADRMLGIWKSPSGGAFPLQGLAAKPLSSMESDRLNAAHISPIREFQGIGTVLWGARTLDRINGENRFIPHVRTRHWIAASASRWLGFAAAEDNDPLLWSRIRAGLEVFLDRLWRDGALLGASSRDAYFVRCDASTISSTELALHQAVVNYGMALLRPAEFDFNRLTAIAYDDQRPTPSPEVRLQQTPGDGVVIAQERAVGFLHVLEFNAGLDPDGWAPTGPALMGDGAWHRDAFEPSGPQGMFRMRVLPPLR